MTSKANRGNFFEDFKKGQAIKHAVPRTITEGDCALYIALTGDRAPLHCSAEFAKDLGFKRETVNDLLVFHIVFGKTVQDISLNAVANLGYAGVRFLTPVYPEDTLRAETEIVGLRESSGGDTGVVYVHTKGFNQKDEVVIEFYRWVLVHKKDSTKPTGHADKPDLPKKVEGAALRVPEGLRMDRFPRWATGGTHLFEDYEIGERIYHSDGMTLEEADHMTATRLYQNTSRVHFNEHQMKESRFKRRLVYGGHVISIARALSFNGMENVLGILAWNGGAHSNPTFAGDTLYAFTEITGKTEIQGRTNLGALNARLVAVKNLNPEKDEIEVKVKDDKGKESYHPNVVLDMDWWLLMPKKEVFKATK